MVKGGRSSTVGRCLKRDIMLNNAKVKVEINESPSMSLNLMHIFNLNQAKRESHWNFRDKMAMVGQDPDNGQGVLSICYTYLPGHFKHTSKLYNRFDVTKRYVSS